MVWVVDCYEREVGWRSVEERVQACWKMRNIICLSAKDQNIMDVYNNLASPWLEGTSKGLDGQHAECQQNLKFWFSQIFILLLCTWNQPWFAQRNGGSGSQVGPDWATNWRDRARTEEVTFMSVPPWLLENDLSIYKICHCTAYTRHHHHHHTHLCPRAENG